MNNDKKHLDYNLIFLLCVLGFIFMGLMALGWMFGDARIESAKTFSSKVETVLPDGCSITPVPDFYETYVITCDGKFEQLVK